MPETAAIPTEGPIHARVTPWFYRRMAYMALIFLGFGLFFFYDGKWGYPKENKIHEEKTVLLEERTAWEEAKRGGEEKVAQWQAATKDKTFPKKADGEPLDWETHAANNGWATDPKFHSPEKIQEQFHFAWGCFVFGAIPLILIFLNRGKSVSADDTSFTLPGGQPIPFSDVRVVDKRKWENKGLAYIEHSPEVGQPTKKAKLDCLKFHTDTMEEVLRRIRGNFSGELIEKIAAPDDEEDEEDEDVADAADDTASPQEDSPTSGKSI